MKYTYTWLCEGDLRGRTAIVLLARLDLAASPIHPLREPSFLAHPISLMGGSILFMMHQFSYHGAAKFCCIETHGGRLLRANNKFNYVQSFCQK